MILSSMSMVHLLDRCLCVGNSYDMKNSVGVCTLILLQSAGVFNYTLVFQHLIKDISVHVVNLYAKQLACIAHNRP